MTDFSGDFSLYVHIPFCRSKCSYCDFLSFADCGRMGEYFDALCTEVEAKGRRYPREVDSVYIGGGTPSLAYRYFPKLNDALRRAFRIKEGAEVSIECNPESVSEGFIAAAKAMGVNRVSLGVQTLSDPLLKRIGRAHDREQGVKALRMLRRSFPSLSADIMVGLPDQREADLDDTLDTILSFAPEHLSCYALILEKGTKLYREAKRGVFRPNDDFAVDLYDRACARLGRAGLSRYEISNFCREGKMCRYNTSVWQYADYLGLGLGASSFLKKEGGFPAARFKNTRDLDRYIGARGCAPVRREKIDPAEGRREFIMLGLRTAKGIDLARFCKLFGADFYMEYGDKVEKMREYLSFDEKRVAIKPEYFYVSNPLISSLIF